MPIERDRRNPRGERNLEEKAGVGATWPPLAPTSQTSEDTTMLKKAKSKAGLILASSAELYREITVSALSLVSARR